MLKSICMSHIRTFPRPLCPVCGSAGIARYSKMKDTMFGTEGLWSMSECLEKKCKTIWLNPTPIVEDIPKMYESYSTHMEYISVDVPKNPVRSLLENIRTSLLYHRYGYGNKKPFAKLLFPLAYLHPGWKDAQEVNIFYLPAHTNGLLLDVGCGSGGSILTMMKKGWRGMGIDFDEKAIEQAKKKGLDVHIGDVFSLHLPDNHVDAILMNHVIEHLPNPKETLIECKRILKKNGVLVAITPNADGFGHAYYKHFWRGLETPTHLQVFTVASLGAIARQAGFADTKQFSSLQGEMYILESSANMKTNGTFDIPQKNISGKILHQIKWFLLSWAHILLPGSGEVAVIVCRK